VVLEIAEEARAGEPGCGTPVAPPAVSGVAAGVDERRAKRLREVLERPEVLVVAVALAREHGVEGVVEVVAPLRVGAVAARLAPPDEARVVQVALEDHPERAAERRGERPDARRDLFEEVDGRRVDDRVHGVQAEAVQMVVAEPHAGVGEEELPHLVAPRAVEAHGGAPRRAVAVGEVRAELAEVVPVGAEVVVDDVEHDGEPVRVAGVDEPLETVGAAVRVMRCPEVDAVVAPAVRPGELRDGHELDGRHAEVDEPGELRDRRAEGPRGRERADVQLVEDGRRERPGAPAGVRPAEGAVVDEARRPVHAGRLEGRAGVGPGRSAVEREGVVGAGPGVRDHGLEPPAAGGRHRVTRVADEDVRAGGVRGPNTEPVHATPGGGGRRGSVPGATRAGPRRPRPRPP
jgi:hypothetical protein